MFGTTSEDYQATVNHNLYKSNATMQGVSYQYVIATNVYPYQDSIYMNASEFPLRDRLELVI